jgi:hypothetical protein
LRVFEKRVQRLIFGPKKEEVTGSWIKLHDEGLHNIYYQILLENLIKEDGNG